MPILIESLNLRDAEKLLVSKALAEFGSIVGAAKALGITRHALTRRMKKHRIEWEPSTTASDPTTAPSPSPA